MLHFDLRSHRAESRRARKSRTVQQRRLTLEALEDRTLMAGDVVIQSNNLLLDAVRADGTNPPVTSRQLAILHTAIYDAVNSIDRTHAPYAVQLLTPPSTSREAAVAAAAYTTLSSFYPAKEAIFNDFLVSVLDAIPDGPSEDAGVNLGTAVADEILALRGTDGWNAPTDYMPGDQPGQWRPTLPAFAAGLLPEWGNVTPWAMTSNDQFFVNNIPELTSQEYADAVNEVKAFGAKTGSVRTDDQTQIGLFWNNGRFTSTPPGHLNIMAQIAAEQQGNTLSENARMFALLNLAQADAAIMCWNIKFTTDFWRPITAIREADTDGNDATTADPTWESLIPTPPFPTYTSGHSTFSGAAAAVLADFFGTDNISFTLPSESDGVADRDYTSFSQAAEESRDSRLYGGIHFRFDNEDGYDSGFALGEFISGNLLQDIPDQPIVEQEGGTLTIFGTTRRDVINVNSVGSGLRVIVNGQRFGNFQGVESIVADGGDGNDVIVIAGNVRIDAELYGGDGNDVLIGARGNDILLGGAGNDHLVGNNGDDSLSGEEGNDRLAGGSGNDHLDGGDGNDMLLGQGGHDILLGGLGTDQAFGGLGRDLIIGGDGRDWLFGHGDDDILIGGSTTHDQDAEALAAILADWKTQASIDDRLALLAPVLNESTVLDDGQADELFGGGGQDWYIDFEDDDGIHGLSRNRRFGDRLN